MSSTSDLDPLQYPAECISGSEEQSAALSSNAENSESSNEPGAQAAAAAAVSTCHLPAVASQDKPKIYEESFDVCFQKTGEPLNADVLSVEELKLREASDIEQSREIIKSRYTELTIACLKNLGVSEETSKEVADHVMNGEQVEMNADEDEEHSVHDIYEFYRYWGAIESYQCLLISSPWSIETKPEVQRRRDEMKYFCLQAFPLEHFDAERLDKTIACREVSNIQQIKTFVRDFFRRQDGIRAKNALLAVIVFFGHGSKQGFCLGQKQHMVLDQIMLLTKGEFRRAILKQPEELPVKVEVIFSQCYGHMHSQSVQTDRFTVIALTTPDYPVTTSTDGAEGFVNNDLEVHAAGTLRQKVNKMEVWRRSDGDGFVDLGQRSGDVTEHSPTTLTTEDSVVHDTDAHQARPTLAYFEKLTKKLMANKFISVSYQVVWQSGVFAMLTGYYIGCRLRHNLHKDVGLRMGNTIIAVAFYSWGATLVGVRSHYGRSLGVTGVNIPQSHRTATLLRLWGTLNLVWSLAADAASWCSMVLLWSAVFLCYSKS